MRVKAFSGAFAVIAVFLLSSCAPVSRVVKQDAGPLSGAEELRLAMAYESKEMLEPALKSYSRVLDLEPTDARAHFGMGNVYLKMRRYDEAEEHYKKAIELDPSKGAFYNNLAWLYIETANVITAMSMANRGMALDMERRYIYLSRSASPIHCSPITPRRRCILKTPHLPCLPRTCADNSTYTPICSKSTKSRIKRKRRPRRWKNSKSSAPAFP